METSSNLSNGKKSSWEVVRRHFGFYNHHEEYLLGITYEGLTGQKLKKTSIVNGRLVVDENPVPLQSAFKPEEMRCLALVAHNHMKPAMKAFVEHRKELLKKFRLTGTNTTITMLKSVFGDDKNVVYGPGFKSGPLGGDAEVCALMCREDLGGVIFFMDPLDSHPHQADIDALVRLSNVQNVLLITNPASAHALCYVLEMALKDGRKDIIPSFFSTLESPGIKVYNQKQKQQVEALKTEERNLETLEEERHLEKNLETLKV